METNNHELIDLYDEALRRFGKRADRVEEESREINACTRLIEAAKEKISENDDLKEELDRKQEEIDDLSEQLEQRDQVIADLRQQLLEAQNQQLESEKQQLETEVSAKPTEIHNHFEPGSSAQVFNGSISGCVFAMPGSTVTQNSPGTGPLTSRCWIVRVMWTLRAMRV